MSEPSLKSVSIKFVIIRLCVQTQVERDVLPYFIVWAMRLTRAAWNVVNGPVSTKLWTGGGIRTPWYYEPQGALRHMILESSVRYGTLLIIL